MYRGTVKIHGTNGSVLKNFSTGQKWVQSRENILSETTDNANFCKWAMSENQPFWEKIFDIFSKKLTGNQNSVGVFGEWAGIGVQDSVAISKVPPFFTIFGVVLLDEEDPESRQWLSGEEVYEALTQVRKNVEAPRIFHEFDFPVVYESLDFSNPEEIANKLALFVSEVEKACPVGSHFGVEGTGEGLVWTCISPGWTASKFRFKLKGEKHQISKQKTKVAIAPEVQESINAFAEYACTQSRFQQGLQQAIEGQGKSFVLDNIGFFIEWVVKDVLKEELDVIETSALDLKKVKKTLGACARKWYLENMKKY